jgi:sialic acid synthase SpsE
LSYVADLQAHAKLHNIDFFSTPFDIESIQALEKINVPFYKVASFDLINRELLRALSDTKKTIICSVGMGDLQEIHTAVDILTKQGTKKKRSFASLHFSIPN